MPLKLKACPWCGWYLTSFVIFDRKQKPLKYHVACLHCGFEAKESRFRWRSRYLWNHTKPLKKKGYHIYGREF